jgi:hypothetical protein
MTIAAIAVVSKTRRGIERCISKRLTFSGSAVCPIEDIGINSAHGRVCAAPRLAVMFRLRSDEIFQLLRSGPEMITS